MPFEPGGRSDKLGNSYEDKWVVTQFLKLVNEEIVSVCVAPAGESEEGVDLTVTQKDGHSMLFQCKGRNGLKENWTVAD